VCAHRRRFHVQVLTDMDTVDLVTAQTPATPMSATPYVHTPVADTSPDGLFGTTGSGSGGSANKVIEIILVSMGANGARPHLFVLHADLTLAVYECYAFDGGWVGKKFKCYSRTSTDKSAACVSVGVVARLAYYAMRAHSTHSPSKRHYLAICSRLTRASVATTIQPCSPPARIRTGL
jgi:hypothetical protein